MSYEGWLDALYCRACGYHFLEDEVAQDPLLRNVCPHCGSPDIYTEDPDPDPDYHDHQEPNQEPDYPT